MLGGGVQALPVAMKLPQLLAVREHRHLHHVVRIPGEAADL
jgi:hypothetical protein